MSWRWLLGIDAAVCVLLGWASAVVCWVGPHAHEARFVGLHLAVMLQLWRATLVPSRPGRTALIGGFSLLPCVVPALVSIPGLDAQSLVAKSQQTAIFVVWSAMAIALATFTSATLYALRRTARKAERLGRYDLEGQLGVGGMGEVYRARHVLLRRPTAVKLLRPDRAGLGAIARFEREVQITASLTHPNTIQVYDYGRTADRRFYYAMELLDGHDLEVVVERSGPLPTARVLHILGQVLGSLAEAHGRGLLHRDVKAANVVLCRYGGLYDWAKVLDFGLAREQAGPEVEGTNPGTVVGTPAYLAPECWHGAQHAAAASDLYAVGVLAWFLLVGRLPFEPGSKTALLLAHLHDAPERPSEARREELPPRFEELVLALLAKRPEDRPTAPEALETVRALERELGSWTQLDARAWWLGEGAAPSVRVDAGPLPEGATVRMATTRG